jgi:glutamine amidotransferase
VKPGVTIVDYGVGNLFSVRGALEYCDAQPQFSSSPQAIENADRLLLPGVGAFADSMADMRDCNLVEPVLRFAETGRPLLGICLGMQMLMEESEEFGLHEGLGVVKGRVVPIPPNGADGEPHRIPHVGWNELYPSHPGTWNETLLRDVREGDSVYFVHSFMAVPEVPGHRVADCDYHGQKICAVLQRENVFGCQFHPEKSGEVGIQILRNFIALH